MTAVDTHILIWDALEPSRLSSTAKEAITSANETDGLLVSDISLWEIAMLIDKGRIQVDTDCQSFLELIVNANQIHVQPIMTEIAARSTQLPSLINADPADRLIVATALAHDVPLVTADRNLRDAELITTIW
ncbi:MAG: type II toxin-antitoxin system VapC family toxin [Chloroflexota bacterium]